MPTKLPLLSSGWSTFHPRLCLLLISVIRFMSVQSHFRFRYFMEFPFGRATDSSCFYWGIKNLLQHRTRRGPTVRPTVRLTTHGKMAASFIADIWYFFVGLSMALPAFRAIGNGSSSFPAFRDDHVQAETFRGYQKMYHHACMNACHHICVPSVLKVCSVCRWCCIISLWSGDFPYGLMNVSSLTFRVCVCVLSGHRW